MKEINKKILVFSFFMLIVSLFSINIKNNNISEMKLLNQQINLKNIIIIGDSRMSLIDDSRDHYNLPNSIKIDAKSGAKIDWLKNEGLIELFKMIDKNEKYYVVFNMGVNDLNDDINIKLRAQNYYNLYYNLSKTFKNINFYYLTVNPVDDNTINDIWQGNIRSNKKIEKFNRYIEDLIKLQDITNLKYCDSYNSLIFNLPDGLHYDETTNYYILNYIINACTV